MKSKIPLEEKLYVSKDAAILCLGREPIELMEKLRAQDIKDGIILESANAKRVKEKWGLP